VFTRAITLGWLLFAATSKGDEVAILAAQGAR